MLLIWLENVKLPAVAFPCICTTFEAIIEKNVNIILINSSMDCKIIVPLRLITKHHCQKDFTFTSRLIRDSHYLNHKANIFSSFPCTLHHVFNARRVMTFPVFCFVFARHYACLSCNWSSTSWCLCMDMFKIRCNDAMIPSLFTIVKSFSVWILTSLTVLQSIESTSWMICPWWILHFARKLISIY